MMTKRESLFGKKNFEASDPINHLFPGTFYLTKVDDKYRRFYEIKGADAADFESAKHFNWTGELKP